MITTFPAILKERKQLTDDVYWFRFDNQGHPMEFKSGQYVILHIPQEEGATARRLYSMSSPNTDTMGFELIVEILPDGVASKHLMKMQPGETLTVQGPAGMFFLNPSDRDVVFLATGTGIAPIRSMLLELLADPTDRKVFLFWGHPHLKDVYLLDEFITLAEKDSRFRFCNCLSRETDLNSILPDERQRAYFAMGHVNDAFDEYLGTDLTPYKYYLCGAQKVVESLREVLTAKGVEKANLHFEKFTT
jgi:NAD(P)H-flavin reductase